MTSQVLLRALPSSFDKDSKKLLEEKLEMGTASSTKVCDDIHDD